jgi:hypothetical protein
VGGVEFVLPFPFPLSSFAFARLCHRGANYFNEGVALGEGGRLTYFGTRSESDAPACLAAH